MVIVVLLEPAVINQLHLGHRSARRGRKAIINILNRRSIGCSGQHPW